MRQGRGARSSCRSCWSGCCWLWTWQWGRLVKKLHTGWPQQQYPASQTDQLLLRPAWGAAVAVGRGCGGSSQHWRPTDSTQLPHMGPFLSKVSKAQATLAEQHHPFLGCTRPVGSPDTPLSQGCCSLRFCPFAVLNAAKIPFYNL